MAKTPKSKKESEKKASALKASARIKKPKEKRAAKTAKVAVQGGQKLVIVESPTKAKTIRKFLPAGYRVEACVGHIRDLPKSAKEIPLKYKKEKWASLGIDVEHDFEPLYVVPAEKAKVIKLLKDELAKSSELILATDEDREGESISQHLVAVLRPQVPIKRMVFHEITKKAIQEALENFREIDHKLVRAQESRRILDRLVGYSLSPLIWKKVAYGLSVGRVQSVAVRIIVDREAERLKFVKGFYCGIFANLGSSGQEFDAKLQRWKGDRVATGKDFDELTGTILDKKGIHLLQKKEADSLVEKSKKSDWIVREIIEKPISRRPAPPFITSTLQQEANRKLGLSTRDAMRIAQSLYQQGFITYMRTDSVSLSTEAIQSARRQVENLYGQEYLSPEIRQYKSNSKNAQEAHEAIRPAGTEFLRPEDTALRGKEKDLYELIWKRTMATQMAESKQLSVSVSIDVGDAEFQANGTRMLFAGFLRAYVEGTDDVEAALEEKEVLLPELKAGQKLKLNAAEVTEHETKPAARYTEATLVQRLEKEGVGRPSTYASIIGTIIDRGYVRRVGTSMVPTFTAFAVVRLLEKHFPELVDYKFTAGLEETLDDIANGTKNYLVFLKEFYSDKKTGLAEQILKREKNIDPEEARAVRFDKFPSIEFRIGRFGPYIAGKGEKDSESIRASIPEDIAPADLDEATLQRLLQAKKDGPPTLGLDPETNKKVYLMNGRYGPYLQLGMGEEPVAQELSLAQLSEISAKENEEKAKKGGKKARKKSEKTLKKEAAAKFKSNIKRAMIPKGIDPQTMKLDQALGYLRLPRLLGLDADGHSIRAGMGKFGPYIVKSGAGLEKPEYRSLKKEDDVLFVALPRALQIFSEPKLSRGGKRRAAAIRKVGDHPEDKLPIELFDGPYGPYVKCGKVNASLPKEKQPEELSLEEAIELIEARKKAS